MFKQTAAMAALLAGAEARSSELFLMEQALDQYTELADDSGAASNSSSSASTGNKGSAQKGEFKVGLGTGCTGYVSSTYQLYSFKKLE